MNNFLKVMAIKNGIKIYPSPSIISVTSSNTIARNVMEIDVPTKVDAVIEEVDSENICDDINMVSHVNEFDTKVVPHHD